MVGLGADEKSGSLDLSKIIQQCARVVKVKRTLVGYGKQKHNLLRRTVCK